MNGASGMLKNLMVLGYNFTVVKLMIKHPQNHHKWVLYRQSPHGRFMTLGLPHIYIYICII